MSENYKKEVKSVKPVFKPAWKLLDELRNEALSELKTDTRNICTRKILKKGVKWVGPVFNPA
jgi:hypothetical protein